VRTAQDVAGWPTESLAQSPHKAVAIATMLQQHQQYTQLVKSNINFPLKFPQHFTTLVLIIQYISETHRKLPADTLSHPLMATNLEKSVSVKEFTSPPIQNPIDWFPVFVLDILSTKSDYTHTQEYFTNHYYHTFT